MKFERFCHSGILAMYGSPASRRRSSEMEDQASLPFFAYFWCLTQSACLCGGAQNLSRRVGHQIDNDLLTDDDHGDHPFCVESDGVGVTSSMRPIFMPARASA